jgi:hypothetical protein
MAPRCKLVSLKVLNDNGYGRLSSVIEALLWVRQVNRRREARRPIP